MSLEQEVKDRIQEALDSNKLDLRFAKVFSDILHEGDSSKLDQRFAYHVKAKEGLDYKGLNHVAGEIYTARTTLIELINFIENSDFYVFQAPQEIISC